ncbi:glycosyl transferase [Massilia sp. WF1]|uniref:glycosyltransferase family 4 protein n=1 Tax=unclassified Massilia TaxID=2609279 RepID=UPI00064A5342|nr:MULTISPECIES: glycosyltransferase family 4 protein [unclassified Massilia]ALK96690.1 glycosyltransferase WbuB [Massilia sp. WG5]KLU38035.1 glycosyl transferase [Massilia sp. WF1]
MRILYINHYAGSPRHGMEYRPYYLAREWVLAGHEVTMVAADQSHIRARQPWMAGCMRVEELIDGIQYIWLKTHPYRGNGIGRVRNMASFVRALYRESKRLSTAYRPDVVIASSTYPMDIWPAHRIASLSGARLVFELHDLWPLTPMELGGMSKWHPFIMLIKAAEDYVYRHADAVVSVLPKVHAHVESHGMPLDRLHIVPNGIDPREWGAAIPALDPAVEDRLAAISEAGKAIVGYAGTHGISNSLDTFLDAAGLMRSEPLTFVLVGGGPEKAGLAQRAQAARLDNVCFIDPVIKEQVPALLQRFDLAYIGWRRQSLYRFGIAPNKLMDYMMAARPVLHAVEAGNDPVGEAGCGLTVAPESPDATAQGIRSLLSLEAAERQAMGQRGRDFVLENLTYPILSKRFLAACA